MKFKVVWFVFALTFGVANSRRLHANVPDIVVELIESFDFDAEVHAEVHEVETVDGYTLKVHRIKPKVPSKVPRLGPVFFMHGLFATSADYIETGPEKALPFLLSMQGYDVWLGNTRGNDHSNKHKSLSRDSKEFWNFSWHEIGYYDLPAMFDLMLEESKADKAFYFGHSQGGTAFAVFLSMRPKYNKKIIQAHLFAPAVFMKNYPNPLTFLIYTDDTEFIRHFLPKVDMIIPMDQTESFNKFLCQENTPTMAICEFILGAVCGFNKKEFETDLYIMPRVLKYLSHSASVKQFLHYGQLYKSGMFRQFDYKSSNMDVYKSSEPPNYRLRNIKVPVYLYTGPNDALVSEKDIETLKKILPNVKKHKSLKNFNHCDFNYSKNAKAMLYDEIIADMNSEKGNRTI